MGGAWCVFTQQHKHTIMVELRAWMDGKFDNFHKNFILKALKILFVDFWKWRDFNWNSYTWKSPKGLLVGIEKPECKRFVRYWRDKKIVLKGGYMFNAWGNLRKLFKYGWSKGAFAKAQLVSCFQVLKFCMFIDHGLIGWHGVHDLMCHAKEIKGQESFTHWNYIKGTWIQTSPCSISEHGTTLWSKLLI